MTMLAWFNGLPALTWAFPVVALLYFKVWPLVLGRPPAKWTTVSPFVSIVVPMTLLVGIVYERELLTATSLGLFAVAFVVELWMFAWAIAERRKAAAPDAGSDGGEGGVVH